MWDAILNIAASILAAIAGVVGDWGLAIVLVTIVIRLLLFPLQRKQLKSNFEMQQMQPKIKRIQEIYEGDQQKIQEETMKIYKETGFNPAAGCLPMIIQMPIFIILFQTLRNKLPEGVSFYHILDDLSINIQASGFDPVYIIFGIAFVAFSVFPMILQLRKQTDSQQKSTTMMMLVMMGVMFIWMAWISPAGVILYWSLSSLFGVVQQLIQHKTMEKHKQEEEDLKMPVKPVEVNVQRKEKKKRPHKSR